MPSPTDPKIKLLSDMVGLYSPTGQENGIARYLVENMRSLGLHSRIDEVGNAIGESPGGTPTILLCGHVDTIPGKLPVRLEGNKLYGRGSVDAKSALAAMICAAAALHGKGFPSKFIVVGAVGEEGNSRGVRNLVEKGLQVDYAIFGEPSGVENITIAYKGSLQLKFTCKTKTGHSSAPWLYCNAVEEAFDLLQEVRKIRFSEEKQESRFYSINSALTEIHGGGPTATIPSECELHANFRVPPTIHPETFFQEVLKKIEAFHSSHPNTRVDVKAEDLCEGYEADRNSILVRGLSWAVRNVRGIPATLLRKTGTGDMNIFGAAFHIPIVTYGPGDSRLDHTDDECVDLNEYLDSIEVLKKGLTRTLELHNRLRKTGIQ